MDHITSRTVQVEKTIFVTSDGKEFETKTAAQFHYENNIKRQEVSEAFHKLFPVKAKPEMILLLDQEVQEGYDTPAVGWFVKIDSEKQLWTIHDYIIMNFYEFNYLSHYFNDDFTYEILPWKWHLVYAGTINNKKNEFRVLSEDEIRSIIELRKRQLGKIVDIIGENDER